MKEMSKIIWQSKCTTQLWWYAEVVNFRRTKSVPVHSSQKVLVEAVKTVKLWKQPQAILYLKIKHLKKTAELPTYHCFIIQPIKNELLKTLKC